MMQGADDAAPVDPVASSTSSYGPFWWTASGSIALWALLALVNHFRGSASQSSSSAAKADEKVRLPPHVSTHTLATASIYI